MRKDRLIKAWLLILCLLVVSGFIISNVHHVNDDVESNMNSDSNNYTYSNEPSPPPPQSLSEHIVAYHIDVALDAQRKKLQGTQVVTWKHSGQEPIDALYMHLYPNAFQSMTSTFIKESGGRLREDTMKKGSFGHMSISHIRTEDGDNLTSHMSFVQPDDGNVHDQTLMKLRLLRPLMPGEQITLYLQFEVVLPSVFARMGYVGDDFIMAGQWFPKLAVYERKGVRGRETEGWNLHQYHGNSEFYADFGIYNVRIQVPSDYIVAATGFPTKKPIVKGETKTYHFYADDVHDFAWSASPRFIYVEEPFSTPDIPGVKIKLYLDPKHEPLRERYMYAAQRALTRFSEWYGTYPYSTLSIVVPPEGGSGAGGMEYPTLITAWAADEAEPGFELERVIVHEIAHQYFYGMVASNEFEEAWLDEAFTSYAEDKLMKWEYGLAPHLPIEASYVTSPAALQKFSWEYEDHGHYADNVYIRGKLVLQDIEQIIGSPLMGHVLKQYVQRWKFKHPTTRDFQTIMEELTNRSWQAYFDDFIYGGQMVDYAVESIHTQDIVHKDKPAFESLITISNHGPAHHPVSILFHFTDGQAVIKSWNGAEPRINFKLIHDAPVDWVMIDPDYALILENKQINNFMKTTLTLKNKLRWHLGTVKIIETLINWVAW